MDFNWFFRKGRQDFYNSDFFSGKENVDGDNEKNDISSFGISNKDPSFDIEKSYIGMFEQMENMLNRMFIPLNPIKMEENQGELDPRSVMLKDPDCKNCDHHPKDIKLIDSSEHKKLMGPGKISKLFEPRNHNQFIDSGSIESEIKRFLLDDEFSNDFFPVTHSHENNESEFVETVDSPDGSFVKRVTVNDGQGFKQVRIVQVFHPKFNIQNDNKVSEHEKRCENLTSKAPLPHPVNAENLDPKVNSSPGDPTYLSLFKKFFGI